MDYEKKSTQTVYLYTYQGIVSESLIPADWMPQFVG